MPKTIGKKLPYDDDDEAPTCPEGLVFGKHFNKDDACADCQKYLSCRRASKALSN